MNRSPRIWLRRHRWHFCIAAGLVIGLWIAPYFCLRQQAIVLSSGGVDYRFVVMPFPTPDHTEVIFRPLVRLDRSLTGEVVVLERGPVFVGSTAIF